ncbi:MAG: Hsp33 family molecular chaperone HslO [Proteobacteria bacterium]|nr:MAG: Hsp33 family molecular chaperone HslO [Pseudomonadota bacterium]
MNDRDEIQRFLFQDFNVRGEVAHLDASYREVLSQREYPEPVRILLGEILAATALLSATIKFHGALTLQVKTDGRIALLMAECRNQTDLRAIARLDDASDGPWLGDGQLVITIEPQVGERYQGIVSLGGATLALAIETYFRQSEQLGTRIWLSADGQRAGGLMLQRLPGESDRTPLAEPEEDWQRTTLLADTVSGDELVGLDPVTLLTRLFHDEQVRLYDPRALRFRCNCSRERSANAIKFLGYDEAMELIEENGEVEIDCQFCHARYRFGGDEVRGVFEQEAAPAGTTLH